MKGLSWRIGERVSVRRILLFIYLRTHHHGEETKNERPEHQNLNGSSSNNARNCLTSTACEVPPTRISRQTFATYFMISISFSYWMGHCIVRGGGIGTLG